MESGPSMRSKEELALERILNIHLILNQVLRYLLFQDLLNCSTLSRQWYRETRKYMLKQRTCVVALKQPSCLELKRLDDFLSTRGVVSSPLPICGLKSKYFKRLKDSDGCGEGSAELHERIHGLGCQQLFPTVFSALKLTFFDWSDWCRECPVYFDCMSQLFSHNREVIERIRTFHHSDFDKMGKGSCMLAETDEQSPERNFVLLPKLKELYLRVESKMSVEITKNLTYFIKNCAPNLQVIKGYLPNDVLDDESYLRKYNKYFRHVHFHDSDLSAEQMNAICKHRVRLHKLHLQDVHGTEEVMYKDILCTKNWAPVIIDLVSSCHLSLQRLHCSLSQILQISQASSIPPMVSVTELCLYLHVLPHNLEVSSEFLNLTALAASSSFSRLFPKLIKITFTFQKLSTDSELLKRPVTMNVDELNACCSVNELSFTTDYHLEMRDYVSFCYGDEELLNFIKIFPNVKTLSIEGTPFLKAISRYPHEKINWALETLWLRCIRANEWNWEQFFSKLHPGCRRLIISTVIMIIPEREYPMLEDGYLVPFISTELAQTIIKEHPGLRLEVAHFGSEWKTRRVSDSSFFHLSPFTDIKIEPRKHKYKSLSCQFNSKNCSPSSASTSTMPGQS